MSDEQSFTTSDGRSITAVLAETTGNYYGNSYQPGQWLIEEEKTSDGVKVFSHYVADAPDPAWKRRGTGIDEVLPVKEEGVPAAATFAELDQRSEAELIDLAALYGVEGTPGKGLKEGLIEALRPAIEAEAGEGGSETAVVRSALAGQEGFDLPPNSSSTDPNPRSEDALRADLSEPVDGEPGDDTDGDGDPDRPGGNASTEDWRAYRLNHGYTEAELADYGRDDLRDLEDR